MPGFIGVDASLPILYLLCKREGLIRPSKNEGKERKGGRRKGKKEQYLRQSSLGVRGGRLSFSTISVFLYAFPNENEEEGGRKRKKRRTRMAALRGDAWQNERVPLRGDRNQHPLIF